MKRYILICMLAYSGSTLAVDPVVKLSDTELVDLLKVMQTSGKPDCGSAFFKSSNSPRSLMGWSNRYQEEVEHELNKSLGKTSSHVVGSGPHRACMKTVQYRGAATCKKPGNEGYGKKLMETVTMCNQLLGM